LISKARNWRRLGLLLERSEVFQKIIFKLFVAGSQVTSVINLVAFTYVLQIMVNFGSPFFEMTPYNQKCKFILKTQKRADPR